MDYQTLFALAVGTSYIYYRTYQKVTNDEDDEEDEDEDEQITELKVMTVYNYILKCHYKNEDWQSLLKTVYQNYIMADDKIVFIDGFSIKSLFPTCSLRFVYLFNIARTIVEYRYAKYAPWMYDEILKNIEEDDTAYRCSYNYNNYKYDDDRQYITKICPATMRPYTIDQDTGRLWRDEAIKLFGPLDKQVYSYNYFGIFVKKYKRYPTRNEFILFLAKKMKAREFDTLPKNITTIVEKLWYSYQSILGTNFEKVKVDDFLKLFKESYDPHQRLLIENTHKNWTIIDNE